MLFDTSALSDAALQVQRAAADPEREAATNVLLAGSEAVATNVRRKLHLTMPVGDLQDKVQVESEQNANVLEITATDEDPQRAAAIANAFASEFVAFRARGDRRASRRRRRTCSSSWTRCPPTLPSARTCAPRCSAWRPRTRSPTATRG